MHVAVIVLLSLGAEAGAQERWYRGNTHTHTTVSDGRAAPDVVVRWYQEHGYDFVVLTDHDYRTPIDGLNAVFGAPGKFLVVAGVEVTDCFPVTQEGGRALALPVHLNGIHVREHVRPQRGENIVEIIQRDARTIREAGGIPQLNHPNFFWVLTPEQILAATEVRHFELYNGHPLVNNRGGGGSPSTEEIWDRVLSAGRVLYAMATDDAHEYANFSAAKANPGRAWIMVRAAELTADAIAAAIDRGDFYATTGVRLRAYTASEKVIRIELPENPSPTAPRYRTYFIGKDGAVLKRDDSLRPAYDFRGDEVYVRARIEASDGSIAWTQPVFLKK